LEGLELQSNWSLPSAATLSSDMSPPLISQDALDCFHAGEPSRGPEVREFMSRYEKWLSGVSKGAATDHVAKIALTERLEAVGHFLDRSIGGSDEGEAIHQLRVWSRRAQAALELFSPCLPRAQVQRMKKTLRKLRSAAGDVRDCEIHLDRLQDDQQEAPKRIVRMLKKERRQARQKLKALRRRMLKDGRYQRRVERLLAGIAWPKRHSSRRSPPFAAFCKQQLAPLATEFFNMAGANLRDDETLHALRIAGKKWRYALELAPTVMSSHNHHLLYENLSLAQDRLGEVCDQIAAIEHIRTWLEKSPKKSHRKRLKALLSREEDQQVRLRAQLLRWWTPARRRRIRELWRRAI
jgi:CHAD domain-containing protein